MMTQQDLQKIKNNEVDKAVVYRISHGMVGESLESKEQIYNATAGTSLQSEIVIPYAKIVQLLGAPTFESHSAGDKTDAEWVVKTESGIATIYNWKNGLNYLGDKGIKTDEITEWHIGGKEKTGAEKAIINFLE